jgi:hypothetical protein
MSSIANQKFYRSSPPDKMHIFILISAFLGNSRKTTLFCAEIYLG